MSQDSAYKLPDNIKNMCLQLANYLTRSHGNYYMTDEQMKRAEALRAEIDEMKDAELLALDTFEGLDWIQKWQDKTLTAKEKAYIQKHKKEYIALFIQRAEANYENAVKEMQRAKADIEFWSGKTMTPEQKEILYDLPF